MRARRRVDKYNNEISIDTRGIVSLLLEVGKKYRAICMIGVVDIEHKGNGRVRVHYKKHESDIFRKFDAFGFCYEALKLIRPKVITVIYVGDEREKGLYTIGIDHFNDNARFLNYSKKGYELRCYVPIDCFTFSLRDGYEF